MSAIGQAIISAIFPASQFSDCAAIKSTHLAAHSASEQSTLFTAFHQTLHAAQ
jgi:hypothetical protein